MNHRALLDPLNAADTQAAEQALQHLRANSAFKSVIAVLEQNLCVVRAMYENTPASEFNRGQVFMLKRTIALLNGEDTE